MLIQIIIVPRNGGRRALLSNDRFELIEELDAGSDLVQQAIQGVPSERADCLLLNGAATALTAEELADATLYRIAAG